MSTNNPYDYGDVQNSSSGSRVKVRDKQNRMKKLIFFFSFKRTQRLLNPLFMEIQQNILVKKEKKITILTNGHFI